jgi:hypothetical protein
MTVLSPIRAGDQAARLSPWGAEPGRLWSLWDMITVAIEKYFELGQNAQEMLALLAWAERIAVQDNGIATGLTKRVQILVEDDRDKLIKMLKRAEDVCGVLDLPVIGKQIHWLIDDPPETYREIKIVMSSFRAELTSRLFVHIPQHAAKYYESDSLLSDEVKVAFPSASTEIRNAGNALAAGLGTACVFHAMRAAEIGLRSLGNDLQIKLPKPIELADWQEILNGAAGAIRDIENQTLAARPTKDADLLFYSEAWAQFRFFKNGWRIRVAHARASYNEAQAIEVMGHVVPFFETISARLKE